MTENPVVKAGLAEASAADADAPSAAPMRQSVVVIDDDPLVIAHVQSGIEAHPHLRCIGVAGSLEEARLLVTLRPDLIITDLGLPDGSARDLIEEIRSGGDYAPRILVLSIFGDRETVISAILAGADGYLLKDMDCFAIAQQAVEVLQGGAPLSPSVATYVLRHIRASAHSDAPSTPHLLSPREVELLRLLAKGLSNKQAAKALSLSPHTVGDYVKSIYRKLQVSSRSEAMLRAVEGGILKP